MVGEWMHHDPRDYGDFCPCAVDQWVQVKSTKNGPAGLPRLAGEVYWGVEADCEKPVRWWRMVDQPAPISPALDQVVARLRAFAAAPVHHGPGVPQSTEAMGSITQGEARVLVAEIEKLQAALAWITCSYRLAYAGLSND